MTGRLLLRGGTVLTLGPKDSNHPKADVLIEDGIITEVGPSLRARNAEVIDVSNTIVMPGFVDTHRHVWHSLFRNVGRAPKAISPADIGPHYSPDHVYAATLVGLLGALEAGITTVVDWADISAESQFAEAARQAHVDAGLRTVFAAGKAAWEDALPDPTRVASWEGADSKQTVALGAAPDSSTAWETARNIGFRLHVHAGSAPGSEGEVARLGQENRLGPDVTLVHCTNLSEADLDAISSSGAMVSLAPSLEMTDGFGWPPLQEFIDRGIRPGLGVGSEMEAPGDMFAQMRAANSVQHATLFDLKLAGKAGVPNLLTTRDVIKWSTIGGARAAGLDGSTGSLSPGKRADVLVLRTDRPNIFPVNDPIGAVVWGMDTSNIDWVLVDGEPLVREGATVADVDHARRLATAAQRDVAVAAGLLADAGTAP